MKCQNSTKAKAVTSPATFRLAKWSPSMEETPTASPLVLAQQRHPTTIEFPTTTTNATTTTTTTTTEDDQYGHDDHEEERNINNKSIVHYSHSHHDQLSNVTSLDPFTCSGCKEKGAGKRFACQQCDFQLHEFCALSPPALNSHPLHSQHQHLILRSKPRPGGIMWPRCDVCGKGIKGFTFRCGACNFHMHPCCAMLSDEMNFSAVHPHLLKLLPQLYPHQQYPAASAGAGGETTYTGNINTSCGECKRKRSGRMYRCTICDYHLHAVCAKNIINGLKTNGINLSDDKPSMLGPAARLASQVVIEFIGGLFEGFGEAVGQALLQNINIARSGRRRTRRNQN